MENKINADDLVKNQDIDASHWAAAFMQLFGSDLRRIDEGLMSSWFANSIMVTHDKISNEKDVAVEQLKFENEQLKKLMSVQIDMLEQNKKLTRTLELENMASAQLIAEIEQLKAELIDSKQQVSEYEGLYEESKKMRSEITALKSKLKIASAALEVVKVHNGINAHYPIVYATVTQALRDVGEI